MKFKLVAKTLPIKPPGFEFEVIFPRFIQFIITSSVPVSFNSPTNPPVSSFEEVILADEHTFRITTFPPVHTAAIAPVVLLVITELPVISLIFLISAPFRYRNKPLLVWSFKHKFFME